MRNVQPQSAERRSHGSLGTSKKDRGEGLQSCWPHCGARPWLRHRGGGQGSTNVNVANRTGSLQLQLHTQLPPTILGAAKPGLYAILTQQVLCWVLGVLDTQQGHRITYQSLSEHLPLQLQLVLGTGEKQRILW